MYVKLFIGDISPFLVDARTGTPMNIHSVNILESQQSAAGFVKIDSQKISLSTQYVDSYLASENPENLWYKLQFVSITDGVEKIEVETIPILPEIIADLVDRFRETVQDFDSGEKDDWEPAWEDHEYVTALRSALREHKGTTNLSQFREEDYDPIELLVRITFAHKIIYDTSMYYRLQVQNASLDKSEIAANYTKFVDSARKSYEAMRKNLNFGAGGFGDDQIIHKMPKVNATGSVRLSPTKGIMVRSSRAYSPYRMRRPFAGDPENPYD